jgi:hypothetical protein
MGSRSKPLSSAEQAVLRKLIARGGTWANGDTPLWESRYWTLHLLNRLASQGLVSEVEQDRKYQATRDGLAVNRW